MKAMAMNIRLLVAVATVASLPVSASHAGTVQEKTVYFDVHGTTLSELETDFGRAGPYVPDTGGRRPGAIEINFNGNVSYRRAKGGGCEVAKPDISLSMTTMLPRWDRPAKFDKRTLIVWQILRGDIAVHERHHAATARIWLKKMISAIRNLRPEANCSQMKQKVGSTVQRYLQGHADAQNEFDRIEGYESHIRIKREIFRTLRLAR